MIDAIDVIIPATSRPTVNAVVQHLINFHQYVARIVVVDFMEDQPSLDFNAVGRSSLSNVSIKRVFVSDQAYFNKSLAINIGFHFTCAERVLVCDADVLLHESFLTLTLSQPRTSKRVAFSPCYVEESEGGARRPAPGIVAFDSSSYREIEGYSSEFTGWGMEDMDFLRRLRSSGNDIEQISNAIHLSHPDSDRVCNYDLASVEAMRKRNRMLYEQRLQSNQMNGTLTNDIHRISAAGKLFYDQPAI